jgi:undecaprenol kinase
MNPKEKKAFSLIARFGSIKHAVRGIYIFIKNTHNAWVEIFIGVFLVFLGYCLSISEYEWLFILISIFGLLMAEAFNTAMEVHMDLTSPEFHPFARDTKDIAAGGVLIAAILTLVVSLIIFVPKIICLI